MRSSSSNPSPDMQPSDLQGQLQLIESRGADRVWITKLPCHTVEESASAARGALRGVTFAIKDNIDLEGVPTTAGCPEYAYTPKASAAVVQRLVAAGAVPLGKTNLDQFATG